VTVRNGGLMLAHVWGCVEDKTESPPEEIGYEHLKPRLPEAHMHMIRS